MKRMIAVGTLIAGLLPGPGAAAAPRDWRFQVRLDGRDVGQHEFHLRESGEASELKSEARFDVRILFVNLYAYQHSAVERWRGDCLESIESTTDDNGHPERVRGNRSPSGFAVTTGRDPVDLPGCVMTFAYWNRDFLRQPRLLNPQTGKYVAAQSRVVGPETILVRGRPTSSIRHQLLAEDAVIDIWYSPEGEWLGLASTVGGGHRLEYRLT